MMPFDDADPEDGWDASDAVLYQLENIVVRLRPLLAEVADRPRVARLFDHLEVIRARIAAARRDLG